jgi:putative membrane protein
MTMKKSMLTAALSVCLVGVGFAAQGLTPDETTFIEKAAKGDQAEIALSKLALKHSSDPQIRQFAQEMVTDHSKSTAMLKPIAAQHGVVLADNPGPANAAKAKLLAKNSGANFNKTYLQLMESDHQDTLQAFQSEGPMVKDKKLKEFVVTVQPIVAHHLQMAQQLRGGQKMRKM